MGAELSYSPNWSPAGHLISKWWQGSLRNRSFLARVYLALSRLALGWIAALPYSPKVVHVLTAAINVLLRDLRSKGRLASVNVEAAFESEQPLGLGNIGDLTWKDMLDVVSCTECGRCEMNCPAHISGKLLSPRQIVIKLRDQTDQETPLFGKVKERRPIMGDDTAGRDLGLHDVYGMRRSLSGLHRSSRQDPGTPA